MAKFQIPELCGGDCNHCGINNNRQFTLLINTLSEIFGEGVYTVTQMICPCMTVCADCRIDDFVHCEGCGIADTAEKLASRFVRQLGVRVTYKKGGK